MSKHLKAAIKECRYLLEKDFAAESENSVEETALAFLIQLAVLRCFEEQRWEIPSQLSFSSDYEETFKRLTSSRDMLWSEIGFLLHHHDFPDITPSIPSFKTIFFHFTETISPGKWRSENILGWIYQAFYDNTSEQKQNGQFYTPEPIAEYIVSQVFDRFLNRQKVKGEGQKAKGKRRKVKGKRRKAIPLRSLPFALDPFTLLDLGCGSGVFALRAFDRLYEFYKDDLHCQASSINLSVPQQILEKHLFLVDNDPWACQIAAINLYLKAKSAEPDCIINKMNIFCTDALQRWEKFSPSPNPSHQGRGIRSLFHQGRQINSPLPWWEGQGEGDKLRKLFTRQYDCVVGNPPYIVVNQLRTPKDLIQVYKSYRSAAFKINIFALFIERGIELLKSNGLLGMIVPNTLLTQVYFEPLRKYILQTSKILRILDTKRLFDNVFVENCILLLQREAAMSERAKNVVDCSVNMSNGARKNPQLTTPSPVRGEPVEPHSTSQIPQHHFEKAPFNMFNVRIDEQVFVLMEKIASRNPKLGEICESHDGVNPGNAKHKLIVSEKLDKTCKKVLNGKNIARYWLQWGGLYVRYNRNLLSKGDNVRWGHQPSLDSAKILTRQTADRIIGTFDTGEYYTTNSIHTTILKDGVQGFHLKYLLALLNSKLISFYYRKLFPEDGQVFSQVKLISLRQLPLKEVSSEDQSPFIVQVDALLRERKLLEEFADGEMMWCHLREMDDRLDQKVYELYQLSPEEIQMVEDELGKGVCLYSKVPVDELQKEISFDTFQHQYCECAQTIFHMADQYAVHPESILELRKAYRIFREKGLKKIVFLWR